MNQAARAKIRMKVTVSVEDGRWKLTNDQELSKVLVLLILSCLLYTSDAADED